MGTPAMEFLIKARASADEAEADRLAVAAILAEPDLADAYVVRGELAARRGDAVTAAHHFRVAYARGDRSAVTRAALGICLEVAGQAEAAVGVAAGARLPVALETFGELARILGPAVRGMLALPLAPPGEPALLPGERRPSGVIPRVDAQRPPLPSQPRTSVPPPPARPPSMPPMGIRAPSLPPQPVRSPSAPPLAAAPPSVPPPRVAPPSTPPGQISARNGSTFSDFESGSTPPRARPRSVAVELPEAETEADWLEPHHSRRGPAARSVTRESWLDDDLVPVAAGEPGPRFAPAPLELVVDPGPPEFLQRSPATGQMFGREDVARDRAEAQMPEFVESGRAAPPQAGRPASEPPQAAGPDPLEAGAAFGDVATMVRMAIELPGPVITAAGQKPQQLCVVVALGLTADELLMRDRQRPEVPMVRLPLRALKRMELLREGAQLSFGLSDGRQLHLDLRGLRTRAPSLARMLVGELAVALRALGAQVTT